MKRNNKEFRERFQRWKLGELVYENGRPLPAFEDGKDSMSHYEDGVLPNWYDDFTNNHPKLTTLASFLPLVGTGMDAYEAYKNPTARNIGYAALSGLTDLVGGRLITKLAGNAIKRSRQIKKLTKKYTNEYRQTPAYENNPRAAKYLGRLLALYEVGTLDLDLDLSRYVVPFAVYAPDFLANTNQIRTKQ